MTLALLSWGGPLGEGSELPLPGGFSLPGPTAPTGCCGGQDRGLGTALFFRAFFFGLRGRPANRAWQACSGDRVEWRCGGRSGGCQRQPGENEETSSETRPTRDTAAGWHGQTDTNTHTHMGNCSSQRASFTSHAVAPARLRQIGGASVDSPHRSSLSHNHPHLSCLCCSTL